MLDISMDDLDGGLRAMGCHLNPSNAAKPCAGFMVQVGFGSVGVRLAAQLKYDHPDNYDAGDHELYATFDDMIEAHHHGVERSGGDS
jgi:hypothetical protein